ncbi:MAG: GGDEF domain-containing protein [Candidatus Omnitrophota bacterium]
MEETGRDVSGSHSIEDIFKVLKNEIDQSKEERSLPPIALLLVDIDNLERFNRWYGRGVGNEILDTTAKILMGLLKEGDLLARFGGDEFLILLRGVTLEATREKARRVLGAIRDYKFDLHNLTLSVSIGIAYYFSFAFSPDEFLGCAVEALTLAQKEGGTFKVFMEEEEWDEE